MRVDKIDNAKSKRYLGLGASALIGIIIFTLHDYRFTFTLSFDDTQVFGVIDDIYREFGFSIAARKWLSFYSWLGFFTIYWVQAWRHRMAIGVLVMKVCGALRNLLAKAHSKV